ncbi:MAG TPA: choice-of-anchor D domain-containing protein, partial [bacterium]|nr:choice-of-anchor D domain-containing protein [bacterium]
AVVPVIEAGNALALNGVDQHVMVPNTAELNLTIGTWEAWVRLDNLTHYNRIIFKENFVAVGTVELYHDFTVNNFRAEIMVGSIRYGVSSITQPVQGQWNHVAATYDGSNLRIYVNGTEENSVAVGGVIDYNAGPLGLGGNINGGLSSHLEGQLDEVRIWNIVRTPSEILASFPRPARGDDSGLVALYHFDEASPVTSFDGSRLANDGTIQNGAVVVASGAMAPLPPVGLNTTPFIDSTLTVSWTANSESDLSHYFVYRSITSGFNPTSSDSIGRVNAPTNWFDDNTAQLGVIYYYRIAAVDSVGQISSYSAEVAGYYPTGILAATTTPVNFGNVAVGANTDVQTKIYVNGGWAEITNSSFDFGSQFSLATPLTLPDTLSKGDTLLVDLRFAPNTFGAQTDTLVLANNSGNPSFSIALDGTGISGAIASNLDPVNYGSVAVGLNATQIVKVFSNGGAVEISSASIAGADFSITNAMTLPDTLFSGDTLYVDVQFAPTAFGNLTDTLVVNNNSGTSIFKIALDGTGISGAIASNTNPVNYGNVAVGSNQTQTVKVFSNGGAVEISGASIAGADFSITNAMTLPDTLFGGDTLYVDVQFAPTAFGARTDTLVIINNSGNPTFKIALDGSGVPGNLATTVNPINFGPTAVGYTSTQSVKIFTTGGAVAVNGVNMSDGAQFTITNIGALPDTLFSGDTLYADVQFAPTVFGALTDTLLIGNNSGSPSFKIALDGIGATGTILALPSVSNFGSVPVGDSLQTLIKVFNNGGGVSTSAINLFAGTTFKIDSTVGNTTLMTGDTLRIYAKYYATNFGAQSDTILVANNSVNSTLKIALDGFGVSGTLHADVADVDFDNVAVGDSTDRVVKLYSMGGMVPVFAAINGPVY